MKQDRRAIYALAPKQYPIYYHGDKHRYYKPISDDPRGKCGYVSLNTYGIVRAIHVHTPFLGDKAEDYLEWIEGNQVVWYAGTLAGMRAGIHTIDGRLMLIHSGPRLIKPKPGNADFILKLMEGVLKDEAKYVHAWLLTRYKAIKQQDKRPGLANIICGPVDCYKTFLQNSVFKPILGNRVSNPSRYLLAGTEFNGDLFEAECLFSSDDNVPNNQKKRETYAAGVKNLIANPFQSCHFKGKDAFAFTPIWAVCITCNDKTPHIHAIPAIDATIKNKILLCHAHKYDIGMPNTTDEERGKVDALVASQRPHYLHWLINERSLDSIQSSAYGVKEYQNPYLVGILNALSPDEKFHEIIMDALFGKSAVDIGPWVTKPGEFRKVTAKEVEKALESWSSENGRRPYILDQFYQGTKGLGWKLSDYCELKPDSYLSKSSSDGNIYWIRRPDM